MVDSARDRILSRIRSARVEAIAAPSLAFEPTRYPNKRARFEQMVVAAAGKVIDASGRRLEDVLAEIPEHAAARTRCYDLPKFGLEDRVDERFRSDADHLLDFALIRGEFGVAENGAIWVDDRHTRDRAVWFLAEHLAVVLDPEHIVDTMHDAYAKYPRDCELAHGRFGMFLCGPSKTGDIEQALVIGAHGPRTLTVILERGGR